MSEQTKQTLSLRLPPSVLEKLEQESKTANVSKTDWITQAILEKFARIESNQDRLVGLSKHDCQLVWMLVACLKKSPSGTGFRKAVRANFEWLLETIEESPNAR